MISTKSISTHLAWMASTTSFTGDVILLRYCQSTHFISVVTCFLVIITDSYQSAWWFNQKRGSPKNCFVANRGSSSMLKRRVLISFTPLVKSTNPLSSAVLVGRWTTTTRYSRWERPILWLYRIPLATLDLGREVLAAPFSFSAAEYLTFFTACLEGRRLGCSSSISSSCPVEELLEVGGLWVCLIRAICAKDMDVQLRKMARTWFEMNWSWNGRGAVFCVSRIFRHRVGSSYNSQKFRLWVGSSDKRRLQTSIPRNLRFNPPNSTRF